MAAARGFNRERAAMLLVEAAYASDAEVARKHGITDRTLRNYRKRLDTDPEFSELFRAKKAAADADWSAGLFPAIRGALNFIAKASKEANPSDPAALHAMAGALKITSEVAITRQVIDARLAGQHRPSNEADRQVASEEAAASRVH